MSDLPQDRARAVRRSAALAERFVSLADTLVDDFDVVDLMSELVEACVELVGSDAAGLLLRDPRGHLQLVASSSEESRILELYQLQNDEGPCLDCVADGQPVAVERVSEAGARWPRFTRGAAELGVLSVYAVPMRLREQTVGGLNLFCTADPPLAAEDRRLAQALADIATIGLLQQQSRHRATQLAEQLQGALNSRVVVEQAKGVLAARHGADMETAFRMLRTFARNQNRKLSAVADDVVRRRVDLVAFTDASGQESGSLPGG
jgi:GAF domain-containing protein